MSGAFGMRRVLARGFGMMGVLDIRGVLGGFGIRGVLARTLGIRGF